MTTENDTTPAARLRNALKRATADALADDLDAGVVAAILREASQAAAYRAIARMTGLGETADTIRRFDLLTRKLSAMAHGAEMLVGAGDYRPTIDCRRSSEHRELADLYDALQILRGDPRRAHRAGGFKSDEQIQREHRRAAVKAVRRDRAARARAERARCPGCGEVILDAQDHGYGCGTPDWQPPAGTATPGPSCPECGDDDIDHLVWVDDDTVECHGCGHTWEPGASGPQPPRHAAAGGPATDDREVG